VAVYGLPDDYWQSYRANLEAVGADDVLSAARDLLHPDEYLMLVVGDASRVQGELEAAGLAPLEIVANP
jgi:predicted Zn-dependent peptidase